MRDIPSPVLLNCWKHHAGFIKDQIRREPGLSELIKSIRVIGDGLMDLYTGKLNPFEIGTAILSKLPFDLIPKRYAEWLEEESKGFRNVAINDGSIWTMRLLENNERYIHIHPGRYSPLSLRVKASTLKTAIAAAAWHYTNLREPGLNELNIIRINYLNLSPIKNFDSIPALKNIIKILTS